MAGLLVRRIGAGIRAALFAAMTITIVACGGGGSDTGGGNVVAPPTVGIVTVTLPGTQLQVGAQLTAAAEVRSTAGAVLTGRAITWASANPNVATVSDAGVITGVAPGTASITATSEGKTGTATLAVVLAPVNAVVVSAPSASLVVDRTVQATVVLRDERGVTLSGRTVTWSSSAPTVATVNDAGVVTGVTAGTTTITATSEGRSGTLALTVVPPPVNSVTLVLSQSTVAQGGTTTATVTLRDDRNVALTGRTVTFTSSDATVATANDAGVITALSVGTTTITATSEGRSASASLTVIRPPVASVVVSLPQASLLPGQNSQAAAQTLNAAGAVLSGRDIAWSSSNPAVATVGNTGLVSALSVGTVQIIATSEGRTGQATLTVRSPISTVTVSGSSRVKVGDLYAYSAISRTADGSIVERPVVWSVRETGRAAITQNGALTPLQPGTITLVARIDGDDWVTTLTAYDWEAFSSGGTGFITLDADVRVANRLGTLEYPELIVSCAASAPFFLWVSTPHIITASGAVALSFDGGTPFGQTWQELSPNFRTLWKPGSSSAVLAFAQQVAASRLFGFAFGEFNGSAKATIFRVTGMSASLRSMVNTFCPAFSSLQRGAIMAGEPSASDLLRVMEARARLAAGRSYDTTPSDEARERALRGPVAAPSTLLNAWPVWTTPRQMTARRFPR